MEFFLYLTTPIFIAAILVLFAYGVGKLLVKKQLKKKTHLLLIYALPIIAELFLASLFYLTISSYGGSVQPKAEFILFRLIYGIFISLPIAIIIVLVAITIKEFIEASEPSYSIITSLICALWAFLLFGMLPRSYAIAFQIPVFILRINGYIFMWLQIIMFFAIVLYVLANNEELLKKIQTALEQVKKEKTTRSDKERAKDILYAALGIITAWVGVFTIVSYLNIGLAFFLPQMLFIPFIIAVLIFLVAFATLKYFKKTTVGSFVLALLLTTSFIVPPINDTFIDLQQAHDSLDYLEFAQSPIDSYPVTLDHFRFVDRSLFLDIVESIKLPSPPKPYRITILENYAAIGMLNGKPAWIVPMRYKSTLFNPKTNLMAGYITLYLDNPIPESATIKYVEMKIAPGLDGYRNLETQILQIAPDLVLGENYQFYLIDPWLDGKPAWIVPMSRYSSWGVRIPAGVIVVHSDGTWERLTLKESVSRNIPEPIQQDTFVNIILSAVSFLREGKIDPSARGYLWLPASPDVQNQLDLFFYQKPHHFLVNEFWFGRDFYLKVRTGTKESVVSWIRINDTIQFYDLRSYTKGGLTGVNTPETALSDLNAIAKKTGLSNIDVRYPKLYRISLANATLLLWVSLLIEKQPGTDRFAGAVFVDAANPRISGALPARLGESPDTFKERFINAINLSYIGFLTGNDTISGQTQTDYIPNGTVLRKNWILLQPENEYAIILYLQNNTDQIFVLVTENSVATKDDFYTAAVLKEGDHVFIEVRYDKDHQTWLAYKVQILD